MLQDDIKAHEQFLRERERRNAEVVASLKAGKKPRRFMPRHLRHNVYLTKDDLNQLTKTVRKLSWKEASLAEKVRDGVAPPEMLDYLELNDSGMPPIRPD
jgi:hypothetical protein